MNSDKYNQMIDLINAHGLLLLNSTKEFYNVMDSGGDWFTMIRLIEDRQVYVSKIYKGKTTYLSKELYYALRGCKNDHKMMTEHEKRVYDFLSSCTNVDMDLLKVALNMDRKVLRKTLDTMMKKLLITVLSGGKKITDSWSSYYFGTYEQWESSDQSSIYMDEITAREKVNGYLSKIMTDKQIENLLK
ncbi:hypothetical protein HZI73_16470 [Vallitalea pronyensis]|uniref:Uncharacterized protein n=1 Tax=Vallitalea pronyensis TaxID=1348613 RepID=A0A8J8SHU7_9FIRM|nr:hypothetical protein [Vallitalea pronyensis]QUI23788.1 hypothetical protein HZI73_16470 [Vallitalea pronyensis]